MSKTMVDRFTGGRLWPEHVRFDLSRIDRMIRQIEQRANPDDAEALRLLAGCRAERVRLLRRLAGRTA